MNRWICLLGIWGALALPMAVRAQAVGEASETGPSGAPPAVSEAALARSPLWQAVESMFRQREVGPVPDRRLDAQQRQQLREQVRRAAARGQHHGVAEVTQLGSR